MDKIDIEFMGWISSDIEFANRKIKKHLFKFKNLDYFLERTKHIIKYYYDNQSDFSSIWDFIEYLRKEIKYYVYSFSLKRKDKDKDKERLNLINETYDKLIYFWEENPIEAKRQRIRLLHKICGPKKTNLQCSNQSKNHIIVICKTSTISNYFSYPRV